MLKQNRSRRSLSSNSADTHNNKSVLRVRSVHLRKDQLSDRYLKERIRLVVEENRLPTEKQYSSDEEKDHQRKSELTQNNVEAPDQVLREGRHAIQDGSPSGNWSKYNYARENLSIDQSVSKEEYYECYKRFNRAQQVVDSLNITPNFLINMLQNVEAQNLYPKNLGIVKKDSNISTVLSARRQLLGQSKYSIQMSTLLKNLPKPPKQLDLRDNHLQNESIELILEQLKEGIEKIDLSNNRISKDISVTLNISSLRILILKNTMLTDDGYKQLMKNRMKNLKTLDLSKNLLTDNIALMLPIKENDSLHELYLGWNKFSGRGGATIFKALVQNTSLKVLDLSQNSLGHPEAVTFEHLHKFLIVPNSEIVHLDLSHNGFSQKDCQSIQSSLKGNQQIYGLHLSGNEAFYIDPEGWAVDRNQPPVEHTEIKQFEGHSIDFDEINKQVLNILLMKYEDDLNQYDCKHFDLQIQSIDVKGQNIYQNKRYDLFDNCWVCEGWQEFKFEWVPNVSGPVDQEPMFVHLDFLNYKPIVLQYFNNSFVAYKMCPPNREVHYFYSNPALGLQLIAEDQQIVELQEDHPLRNREEKRPVFKYEDGDAYRSNKMYKANYIKSTQGEVFAKDYTLIVNSQPRGTFRHKDLMAYLLLQQQRWNQQTSIFKNFQGDTDLLMDQCFEHDYECSRIPKLCDNQDHSDIVRETLRQYYRQIFHAYKYYASMSMNLNLPSVSLQLFIEMISKTKIMTIGMRPTDIQVLFISSCSRDNNNTNDKKEYLADKFIVRHQFMEMIVRLAIDKHSKKGLNIQDCITKMFNEDKLMDWLMKFDESQNWRNLRYWNQSCDRILTLCMPAIQQLYVFTASLHIKVYPHRTKLVQFKDFRELCDVVGLSPHIKEREFMNIFLLSIQTQVNEINYINHFIMNIPEFMEAIARIAEKLSPCKEDDKTLKQRRLQPLDRKLHLMLWIFYRLAKPQMKQIFNRKKLEFKDLEFKLFRDLMRQPEANQSQSSKTSPAKLRRGAISMDRLIQSPIKRQGKKPVFSLQHLLGVNDTKLPSIRSQRTRHFKDESISTEQYEVMKCLNFFLDNK